MSSTVNVGALEASLKIGDHYTAVFDKFKADATAISERLTKLENGFSKTDKEVKKSKETVEKIDQSYRKVAASLDPVVAGQQKLDQATKILDASLKKGIITQDQYNNHLAAAKSKYIDNSAAAIKSSKEIERAVQKQALEAQKAAKAQQTENAKVEAAYKRVAASLDPVVANSQKYRNAQNALEAALRKGIVSQKEYNEQLGKAREKFLSGAESAKKYQERVNDIGQKLSHTGSMLTRTVTLPLIGIAGASVKTATDLNKSLANVSALLTDVSGSQLDQAIGSMKTKVRSMSEDLGKSTKDISEGLYEVISSLGYTSDTFIQLEISAKAGAAGVASTQEAFNFLSATTKTYGDTSADAFKKAADLGFQAVNFGQTTFPQLSASIGGVAPLAKLAGVSMEEMFAVIATATGVTGNTAEVVTQMSSAINGLLNPSKDLKVLLKEQGFASGEAMIAQKGLVGTLKELVIYAERTGKPLIELIGRKEGLILAASLAGAQELKFADNLKKMGEAAAANGAVVDAAFTKQTQGVNKAGFAWEQFKAKIETTFQKLGDTLIPIVLSTASAFAPLFNAALRMVEIFGSLPGPIQTVLAVFAATAASIGPVLFISGQLIQSWGALVALSPKLAASIAASAGPWGLIALAIAGVTIAVQAWINKINEAHAKELQQLQTYNETQAMYLDLRQRVKDIADAKDEETKKTLALTKAEWDNIAARLASIKVIREQIAGDLALKQARLTEIESQPKPGSRGPAGFNRARQRSLEADAIRIEIKETEAALRQQDQQWNGLQKTLHELANAGVKASVAVDDTTKSVASLTDGQEKLIKKTDDTIDGLRLKAEHAERLARAILKGTKELKSEELAIDKENIVRDLNNSLAAEGLSLTGRQIDLIGQYIAREKEATEVLNNRSQSLERAISRTGEIAERGFAADFKRFTDEAHRGMELIQIDVEEMLTGLGKIKDLDLDLEFNSRLSEVEPHLRDLEADYLSFLENIGSGFEQAGENAIRAGERILTTLGTRFGKTADEVRAKLQFLADSNLAMDFRDSLLPTQNLRSLRETLARLQTTTDKTGKSLLSAADAQKIYTRALGKVVEETLDAAGNLLSQIGEITGSAGLNKAGNLFGIAGGAVTASNAYAADPSMMAGLNSITAWLALFVGIAEAFTDRGGLHFGAEIRSGGLGSLSVVDDFTYVKGGLHEAQKAAKEVADTIENIVLSFGGQLQSITQFGIIQTGEGWAVSFGGEMRRYFEDFTDAVAWAAHQAISTADVTGISDEILEAFRNFTFRTLEDLQDFSNFAREYTSYGASELTGNLRTLNDWFIESARKAYEYGLSIAKVSEEFGRRSQAWRDQVLGIVRSPEEQIHQNVVDFNNWIDQQRISAQIQIDAANAQMAAAQMQMNAAWAEIKAAGKDADPEMRALFLEAQRLFKDAGARLDMWTKALENLPPAITPEEEEEAKRRARKGGGKGGQRDSVRDWIDDKRFDLDTRGMDEWAKSAADISRQYDEQLKQAGKDKKLRGELLALKERELQLLAAEHMAAVNADYSAFVDQSNAFKEVRDTANKLIEDISNSPFGDAEKAAMIGNVMNEVAEQIEQLSLETASGLFGSLVQDLEKFEATESLQMEARRHMAVLEHTLKMIHYRAEFEILRANGTLSKEILATLEEGIEFLEGIDPLKFVGRKGTGPLVSSEWLARQQQVSSAVDTTVSELEKLRESFRKAKDSILDTVLEFDRGEFGAVVPEAGWNEAKRQFDAIIASAQAGNLAAFQDAPEAFKNTLDVLKEFSPALFATLAPELRNQLKGLADLNTVKEGNLVITDFEKRAQHKETVDTLNTGFSDMSSHSTDQSAKLTAIVVELRRSADLQRELNDRLARLESGKIA